MDKPRPDRIPLAIECALLSPLALWGSVVAVADSGRANPLWDRADLANRRLPPLALANPLHRVKSTQSSRNSVISSCWILSFCFPLLQILIMPVPFEALLPWGIITAVCPSDTFPRPVPVELLLTIDRCSV